MSRDPRTIEVWVGLARILPGADGLAKGRIGGYVNLASKALSRADFGRRAALLVSALGATLGELEDVELFATHLKRGPVPEVELLAKRAQHEPGVHYGSIHWFRHE